MNFLSIKVYYLLLISLFAFISCDDDEFVYPEGGYPYPKNTAANDTNFYFLPIRNSIGRRDSIFILIEKTMYTSFNEPNLSIAPPDEDLFRFYYTGWPGDYAIITLTKDKIIIKEAKKGSPYKAPDENILDSIEQLHIDLFDIQYRLSDPKFPQWRKKYIDSLEKIYPLLFNSAYYVELLNKQFSIVQPFEYSKKEIRISVSKFKKIVALINNSDYWKSPFNKADCSDMDGEDIFLEAITKHKYQCIFHELCSDDTSNLRKAYNEVLKYAGIEDGKLGRQDTILARSTEKVEVRELQLQELKEEPAPKPKKKKAK